MSSPLSAAEIHVALLGLPGWSWQAEALVKTFVFSDFAAALAFMVRVGCTAERLGHHPEWSQVYARVTVRLCTHDAGGRVTALDLELARCCEQAASGG